MIAVNNIKGALRAFIAVKSTTATRRRYYRRSVSTAAKLSHRLVTIKGNNHPEGPVKGQLADYDI